MMNNVVIVFMVFDLVFGMDLDSKNELFTLLPKTSRNQSGGESKALMSGVERILKDGEYYFVKLFFINS